MLLPPRAPNGHIVFIGNVGHAPFRQSSFILVARRRHAAILDGRVLNVAGNVAIYRPSPPIACTPEVVLLTARPPRTSQL